MENDEKELIHDWNTLGESDGARSPVELQDDTLLDGLSGQEALPEERARFFEWMASLRFDAVGLRSSDDLKALEGSKLQPVLTVGPDVEQVRQAVDSGAAVAVRARFDHPALLDALRAAGRPVDLVVQGVVEASPAMLRPLLVAAIAAGVERVCLMDSSGQATPDGTRRLVRFAVKIVADEGAQVPIDWYSANDLDLGVANSLEALSAGARRLHGTMLGRGPRAGFTPLDLLLVNLRLLHYLEHDLHDVPSYAEAVARASEAPIPVNYPVFGKDAFRTATGVHAAAIIKAQGKGDTWLADRVYSAVPASLFGRTQTVEVGPMSGESNVVAWLRQHGLEAPPDLVKRVIGRAKQSTHILTQDEIMEEVQAAQTV
jgi:isopropylmalate/homocitrate/citramalate synthase